MGCGPTSKPCVIVSTTLPGSIALTTATARGHLKRAKPDLMAWLPSVGGSFNAGLDPWKCSTVQSEFPSPHLTQTEPYVPRSEMAMVAIDQRCCTLPAVLTSHRHVCAHRPAARDVAHACRAGRPQPGETGPCSSATWRAAGTSFDRIAPECPTAKSTAGPVELSDTSALSCDTADHTRISNAPSRVSAKVTTCAGG